MILNVASFYPLHVENHYTQINPGKVALALGCFNVAGVIFTPVHSWTISKMGRKTSIILGMFCVLVSNTALGALAYIPDTEWQTFFYLSCGIRFIQGYGDSLSFSTAFSLVASQFPDEKMEYIGYVEAATGFGLMVGPPIGSFMYGWLHYSWAFYIFSIVIGIILILQVCLVPN